MTSIDMKPRPGPETPVVKPSISVDAHHAMIRATSTTTMAPMAPVTIWLSSAIADAELHVERVQQEAADECSRSRR